ncbi:MAG: DUF2950 family protein [Planctomycetes bacterium]|nr:DUF2950 family protein [Planctomycetota bacterium]
MHGTQWAWGRRGGRSGLTLLELTLVLGVISLVLAIVVPIYLRTRLAANETSCATGLREILRVESIWRQNDTDRNGLADYWTADISGLYRIDKNPPPAEPRDAAASEEARKSTAYVAMLDPGLAAADDEPVGRGDYLEGAFVADLSAPAASVLAFKKSEARRGYRFRGLDMDYGTYPEGPYASDPDGNGQKWTSTSRFAFRGRPEQFGRSGVNFFMINQAGVLYRQDFGTGDPTYARNWPGGMPDQVGWRSE